MYKTVAVCVCLRETACVYGFVLPWVSTAILCTNVWGSEHVCFLSSKHVQVSAGVGTNGLHCSRFEHMCTYASGPMWACW